MIVRDCGIYEADECTPGDRCTFFFIWGIVRYSGVVKLTMVQLLLKVDDSDVVEVSDNSPS